MADITNLFKATLKTVRSRLKAQGNNVSQDKSILEKPKKNEFSSKAKEIVSNITKLRDFLLQYRKDYINASCYLGDSRNPMTDAERDEIDTEAEKVMKVCTEAIKKFKGEALTRSVSGQVLDNRHEVFRLIDQYLKAVCKIYSSQRAVRVKRTVDRKRISRLQPEGARKANSFVSRLEEEKKEHNMEGNKQVKPEKPEKPSTSKRLPLAAFLDENESDDDMTTEEKTQLEAENEQLYQEMNSLVDEVRQIEGKVVEISKLQEIFSEKVLEQEKDIDNIANTVVGATENIKEANEDIREAMKNNAGLRVWILFFLIVSTLSLLFLDWYNP